MKSNVILVGFMGSGKTSVGKALSGLLDMAFVDMDDLIVEREGKSIPEIFAQDGEACFRDIERTLVRELAGKSGMVIGAGGGIVLNPDNISDFAATGLVVCLSATAEAVLARVEQDTNRPLLEGGDKMQKIRGILEKRQALYDAVPYQVDTTDMTIEQVAARIAQMHAEYDSA